MATEKDLFKAVKEGLQKDGVTDRLLSEVRYEVLKLLGVTEMKKDKSKPPLPPLLTIINSLVMEYLQWMGYTYSSLMLSTESFSKFSKNYLTRKEMERELHIEEIGEENNDLPLLHILINHLMETDDDLSQ